MFPRKQHNQNLRELSGIEETPLNYSPGCYLGLNVWLAQRCKLIIFSESLVYL